MTRTPSPGRSGVLPRQLRRGDGDGRAGTSAMRQFKTQRASWRRRVRRLLVVFFVGYLALAMIPTHALALTIGSWQTIYLAGGVSGVAITLFIVLRDTPPAHVAQWELGAWAEQETAKRLRPLRRHGWTVLHDRLLQADRAENLDHVLVGPAGVYALDSKRWPGTIAVHPTTGQITVSNPDAPDLATTRDVAAAVRATAWRVNQHLRHARSRGPWVQAVVVIWAVDFPQRAVEVDRVAYVAGDHLRDWLLDQPARPTREDLPDLVAALRQALPTA